MNPTERILFIGVSTADSSIMRIFPRWMAALGLDVALEGCDIPLNAPADAYRQVLKRLEDDPAIRGALVTSHKISLLHACRDRFDALDEAAVICDEVSCVVRRDRRTLGLAMDPLASAAALDDFLPEGHWSADDRDALCLGAGGAAVAISVCLAQRARHQPHPRRFIATDIMPERLEAMRRIHAKLDTPLRFDYHLTGSAAENAAALHDLPPGSLVINATGMGKDLPGSPLADDALFPHDGLVWELNYRGERLFMRQAAAQADARRLKIEDGWRYFLHGWTRVLAEILGFALDSQRFDELARTAARFRDA